MHETRCHYWKESKFLMFDLLKLHHLLGIERKEDKERKERKQGKKERKLQKRNQKKRKDKIRKAIKF